MIVEELQIDTCLHDVGVKIITLGGTWWANTEPGWWIDVHLEKDTPFLLKRLLPNSLKSLNTSTTAARLIYRQSCSVEPESK